MSFQGIRREVLAFDSGATPAAFLFPAQETHQPSSVPPLRKMHADRLPISVLIYTHVPGRWQTRAAQPCTPIRRNRPAPDTRRVDPEAPQQEPGLRSTTLGLPPATRSSSSSVRTTPTFSRSFLRLFLGRGIFDFLFQFTDYFHNESSFLINKIARSRTHTGTSRGPATSYRCTRPEVFPAASASTSATDTRLKSCSMVCLRQDAAAAKSMAFRSSKPSSRL